MKRPISRQKKTYDEDNLEAARIILDSPERYEGALIEWAQLVLKRQPQRSLNGQ